MSLRFSAVVLCASILFTSGRASPSGLGRAESPSDRGLSGNASRHGLRPRITRGIETLQTWYVWDTGRWRTTGWWNAANDVTVLVNYSRLTGSTRYLPVVENTYNVNAPDGFLNDTLKYDDEGWWALAWIDAYDWTQDAVYLDMARAIFADMIGGWDDVCGGGIWWNKNRTYKNAIANELFLSVAAHLANRLTDPDEQAQALAWAQTEWAWFSQSGMINQDNLINDGLNNCQNNHQTTWTYNQGVILAGLVELYQQDQDPAESDAAQAIASAAIDKLTDAEGILHDPCEPTCNHDRLQFKGIFLRNLMALDDAFPDERYEDFAAANAHSILSQAQGPDYQFGQVWSGPFESADAGSQSSALDALIAAAEMRTKAVVPPGVRNDVLQAPVDVELRLREEAPVQTQTRLESNGQHAKHVIRSPATRATKKMVGRMPSSRPACATAAPWFPVLAATTSEMAPAALRADSA